DSERGDVLRLGLDGVRRLAQAGELALREVALDNTADAGRAELRLDAEVDAVDAVLAVDPRAPGHQGAGVLDHGARHPGRRGRGGVESRAALEQADDLRAAVARADDELLDGGGVEEL